MRRALSLLISVLCVAFAVGAISNVMVDNTDVVKMALGVACGDDTGACGAQMTRTERSPFGQTFDFASKKGTVVVSCKRALVLFGDYACEKQ